MGFFGGDNGAAKIVLCSKFSLNQTDYILTPWRFKSSINRAMSRQTIFRTTDINSDHDNEAEIEEKLSESRDNTQVQPLT